MTPRLADLLAAIEAAPVRSPAVLAALLQAPLEASDLERHARFAVDRYVRVLIAAGKGYEVRLLCWRPGQRSALHDHGDAACAFRVIRGTARETRIGCADRALVPGDIATASASDVHQVGNAGDEGLLTLHVYSPPLPVDQPSSRDGHHVVVVGGGFCGVAVAIALLQSGRSDLRITLVERTDDLGRGLAYGTRDPSHLLNVHNARMSLDADDPDAFARFARAHGFDTTAEPLLPRSLYGAYVEEALLDAIRRSPGRVRVVRGLAVDVSPYEVLLADGTSLPAEDVVMATGNEAPAVPVALRGLRDARLISDPWVPGALGSIAPDDRLVVVGTGLTAVDVLSSLRTAGHRGAVTTVSRHGLWPRPHLPGVAWEEPVDLDVLPPPPNTANGWFRWVIEQVRFHEPRGVPWQAVIDEVRTRSTAIWGGLPDRERRLFLKRYLPWWQVHRHRADASLLEGLRLWEAGGRLRTLAGDLAEVAAAPDALVVRVASKKGDQHVRADRIVLCTGADTDARRAANPVLQSLLTRADVASDPFGLGLLTDDDGRAIGADGAVREGLWIVGGARRPGSWEATSVPDLAVQARSIARSIVADRVSPSRASARS